MRGIDISTMRDYLNANNMIAINHQAGDLNSLITPGLWEVTAGTTTNYPEGFGSSIAEIYRKGGQTFMQRLTRLSGGVTSMTSRYTSNNGASWSDWMIYGN